MLALLLLSACNPQLVAARSQFAKAHPGCSDITALRDADGTVHVLGCGSAETYDCLTSTSADNSFSAISVKPMNLERVYGDSYGGETLYDSSGRRLDPYETRPGASPSRAIYRERKTYSSYTSCKQVGDALPPDPSFREGPKPIAAPPVEARTEQGRVTLRLELVLNRTALLTLTADPSAQAERVGFRLFYLAQDPSQDVCKLAFTLDDRPFATPDTTPTRDGQMLSQQLVLDGEKLRSFDQVRRLGLTSCRRGWFLSRDQILRVRELMARFRQEQARTPPH